MRLSLSSYLLLFSICCLSLVATTAGPFQSDALLVPEHCLFDHIHNQTQCRNYDQWNATAGAACADRGMKLKSFAMLLPCGIDVFSGVEFVCCPNSPASNKKGYCTNKLPKMLCTFCFLFKREGSITKEKQIQPL